jgi:hypothetical protein
MIADLRRPETRKPGVHSRDRRISTVSGSASASRVACSWSSWPEVGHTRAEPFTKRSIMHPKKPAGSCSRSATSTRLNAAYADSEPAARCVMLIAAVRAGPSAHESIESSSAVHHQTLPAPEYDGQKPSTMPWISGSRWRFIGVETLISIFRLGWMILQWFRGWSRHPRFW